MGCFGETTKKDAPVKTKPVPSTDDPLIKINQFMEQQLKKMHIPGALLAIIKDGKVVCNRGFGVKSLNRSPDDKGNQMDDKTLHEIGSVTKQFTAAAVGVLVHQKKLEWRTPITTYLPDIKFADPWITKSVTVLDLLSHRTGLGRHDELWFGETENAPASFDLIKNLECLDFEGGFRDSFIYSNLMYALVGHLIATVSEMPYPDFVDKHILHPLGIKDHTWLSKEFETHPDHASPHTSSYTMFDFMHDFKNRKKGDPIDQKITEIPVFNDNNPLMACTGSLHLRTSHALAWIKCWLNDGKSEDGVQVLQEMEVLKTVHNPVGATDDDFSMFGYCIYVLILGCGLEKGSFGSYTMWDHGGGMPGYQTFIRFGRSGESNFGIFFAVNSDVHPTLPLAPNFVTAALLQTEASARVMEKITNDLNEQEEEEIDEMVQTFLPFLAETVPPPNQRFNEFSGKYTNRAFGEIEISKSDLSGHLKLRRGIDEYVAYPMPASEDLPDPSMQFFILYTKMNPTVFKFDENEDKTLSLVSADGIKYDRAL